MEELSATELARRSGVAPERLRRLVELDWTGVIFPEPTVKGAATLDRAAAATGLPEELAGRLTEIVHDLAQRHGGRPVKLLGDGVMFHFPDPPQGVRCALELVDQIPMAGLPRARVGLHSGPVVFQNGDYFGRTVNVAARIGDYARPGEVLVSEEVAAADGSGAVRYDRVGPVSLKGLAAPITICSAARAT